MNFDKISSELVKAIRGKTSCATLSRMLGYKFNKVARWEAGRTRIQWVDFVEIVTIKKCDLRRALNAVSLHPEDIGDSRELMRLLLSQHKPTKTAKMVNCSTQKLNRWLNGESSLNLSAFLKIIHFQKNTLVGFVRELVPVKTVPTLYEIFETEEKERDLHFQHPEVAILLRSLELKQYLDLEIHSDSFIEKITGIPAMRCSWLFQELEAVQAIEKRKKKFVIRKGRDRLGFGHDSRVHQIKTFWLDYALKANFLLPDRQKDWPGSSFFSYNVFSVSKNGWSRITEAHAKFYAQLKEILAEDTDAPDYIKVFNANFIDVQSARIKNN